jgi:predicted 3-demethylubiquinone-9 3-methyltransferase (glyoxalase superfamily)
VADHPARLGDLLGDEDPEKAKRVMQAMLQMSKIEIEGFAAGLRIRLT